MEKLYNESEKKVVKIRKLLDETKDTSPDIIIQRYIRALRSRLTEYDNYQSVSSFDYLLDAFKDYTSYIKHIDTINKTTEKMQIKILEIDKMQNDIKEAIHTLKKLSFRVITKHSVIKKQTA